VTVRHDLWMRHSKLLRPYSRWVSQLSDHATELWRWRKRTPSTGARCNALLSAKTTALKSDILRALQNKSASPSEDHDWLWIKYYRNVRWNTPGSPNHGIKSFRRLQKDWLQQHDRSIKEVLGSSHELLWPYVLLSLFTRTLRSLSSTIRDVHLESVERSDTEYTQNKWRQRNKVENIFDPQRG